MAIKYDRENQTYHAKVENKRRMALLGEKLGFTNIVVERIDYSRNTREGITSSGILVVRPLDSDVIITAFMVRFNKASAVCKAAGKSCVPPKLAAKIRKNAERFPELFGI